RRTSSRPYSGIGRLQKTMTLKGFSISRYPMKRGKESPRTCGKRSLFINALQRWVMRQRNVTWELHIWKDWAQNRIFQKELNGFEGRPVRGMPKPNIVWGWLTVMAPA